MNEWKTLEQTSQKTKKRWGNQKKRYIGFKAIGPALAELLLSAILIHTQQQQREWKKNKERISKPISRQTDSFTMETTTTTTSMVVVMVMVVTKTAAAMAAAVVMELIIVWKEPETIKEMKFTWKILDFSIRHKNYIIQAQIHCKVSMPIACVRCPHELPNIEVENPSSARRDKARQSNSGPTTFSHGT